MSNMLEQAIVDAEALKEAALQNAEQAVIEKYQAEIKNAVESLLEQDEEDPFDEPLDDEDGLESDEDLAQQMPLASTEGDNLCPCPDDEEEVEIDFDQLAQQMQASDEEAGEGIPALDSPLALEEGKDEDDEEIEEEVQITEEELVDILEELTLDMEPTKAGWLQRPDSSVEHEIDILQTKVITFERKLAIIPNGPLLNGNIINHDGTGILRCQASIGVSYDADIPKVKEALMNLCKSHPLVLEDPAPLIQVAENADSSININVRPYTLSNDVWTVYWYLQENFKPTLDAIGVEIPYPHQVEIHKEA